MAKEKFKIITGAYTLLMKNKKVLLAKRYNTGYCDGEWGVPAGHLEENETLIQTAIRECNEETGIRLKKTCLRLVHVMHRKESDGERLNLFFSAKNWKGEPKITEPDKCDALSFFDIDNLPENTIEYVKQAITNISKRTLYSEHGWNNV